MTLLSDLFQIERRYYRSINIENDFGDAGALDGYIVTNTAGSALTRIIGTIATDEANRAWTITGPYGTGKSAFGNLLLALNADHKQDCFQRAFKLIDGRSKTLVKSIAGLPKKGGLLAVACAKSESIEKTLSRALENALESDVLDDALRKKTRNLLSAGDVLAAVKLLSQSAEYLLIVIDEMGKTLEFSASAGADVFLLQELAEIRKSEGSVYFVGLLHQSLSEYAASLSTTEQNSWAKIQGRFEDIAFSESANEVAHLIGNAITKKKSKQLDSEVKQLVDVWRPRVDEGALPTASIETLSKCFPLHPTTTHLLPMLCAKFGQNERSVFSFLTSHEPNAFSMFLSSNILNGHGLPLLKPCQLYDYFSESFTRSFRTRPQLQKWLEIEDCIRSSDSLSAEQIDVLKTVGLMNLISNGGRLRATREFVASSLCDVPSSKELSQWDLVIDSLVADGKLLYRKAFDELRIWKGSDFDIDEAIEQAKPRLNSDLAALLAKILQVSPLVASRHSYESGTIRWFLPVFVSDDAELRSLHAGSNADGVLVYWVGKKEPAEVPESTVDRKPVVLVISNDVELLQHAALELTALEKISAKSPELQSDGVARREVRHRLDAARGHLQQKFDYVFGFEGCSARVRMSNVEAVVKNRAQLVALLSAACDSHFTRAPVLWNELVNKTEVTSQGAKARRELMDAMLLHTSEQRLGLEGYGPEVSIYESLLRAPGIHRQDGDQWILCRPETEGLAFVWDEIVSYLSAPQTRGLGELYAKLQAPPIGMRKGPIPILLAAVLIAHGDEICLYRDGTFIPTLGTEHFELLLKDPSRFAAKRGALTSEQQIFLNSLHQTMGRYVSESSSNEQKRTLLSAVKPLIRFVRSRTNYTKKTSSITEKTLKFRDAVLSATEPDTLLFTTLPQVLDVPQDSLDQLNMAIDEAMSELGNVYGQLIDRCEAILVKHFPAPSNDLQSWLVAHCSKLDLKTCGAFRSFVLQVVEGEYQGRAFVERVIAYIADKPADSWSDDDAMTFESKAAFFAERFLRFLLIKENVGTRTVSRETVQLLTVTGYDGNARDFMIAAGSHKDDNVEAVVSEFIATKLNDPSLSRGAVIASLIEKLAKPVASESLSEILSKGGRK